MVGRDQSGELAPGKPKMVRQNAVKVTATVEAVDLSNRVVSLKGPKGNPFDLKVEEQVEITYTEAVAISVEKAKKK